MARHRRREKTYAQWLTYAPLSGVTSHRQPWQLRGAQNGKEGPKWPELCIKTVRPQRMFAGGGAKIIPVVTPLVYPSNFTKCTHSPMSNYLIKPVMSSIELVCLISVALIQHDTTVEIKQRLRLIDRYIDRLIYIAPINSKESLSASVAK